MTKTKKIEIEIEDISNLTKEEARAKALTLTMEIFVMQNDDPADLLEIAKRFLLMDEIIKTHGEL